MIWIEWKHSLSLLTGLSQDALHIYAALFTQIGSALILKRSLADLLPFFLVFVAVALNEAGDLYFPGNPIESWQIFGSIKDLWNTMLAPFLLLVTTRFHPSIFRPRETADQRLSDDS